MTRFDQFMSSRQKRFDDEEKARREALKRQFEVQKTPEPTTEQNRANAKKFIVSGGKPVPKMSDAQKYIVSAGKPKKKSSIYDDIVKAQGGGLIQPLASGIAFSIANAQNQNRNASQEEKDKMEKALKEVRDNTWKANPAKAPIEFLHRGFNSLAENSLGVPNPNDKSTGNQIADFVADIGGVGASLIAPNPMLGGNSVAGISGQAGESISQKATPFLNKLPGKVLPKLGEKAVEGAGTFGTMAAIRDLQQMDKKNVKDLAKDIAVEGGIGALTGPLGKFIPKKVTQYAEKPGVLPNITKFATEGLPTASAMGGISAAQTAEQGGTPQDIAMSFLKGAGEGYIMHLPAGLKGVAYKIKDSKPLTKFEEAQVKKVPELQKIVEAKQFIDTTPSQEVIDKIKSTGAKPKFTNQQLNDVSLEKNMPDVKRIIPEELKQDRVYKELNEDLEGVNTKSNSKIDAIAPSIKDKSGVTLNLKDVYRNFRDAFGKNYDYVRETYLEPLNQSKFNYTKEVKVNTDRIYNEVVKGLGIQKGSKESAAVQHYGEKQRISKIDKVMDIDTGKMVDQATMVPYTLDDLKAEFPHSWQRIVRADSIFRKTYDELIDKINKSRESIYPNVEKQIKETNDSIEKLRSEINDKTATRVGMENGRPFKTTKEVLIENQLKNLNLRRNKIAEKVGNVKNADAKELLNKQIKSIDAQIKIKQDTLSQANLYGQPTPKQFESMDSKISRLNGMLKEKERLIKSEELWRNKRVPKRNDYYRHFREMSEGFKGLLNAFDTPSQIAPKLVGVSDYTQPNSKFAAFAQRRAKKGKYDADAVEGFVEYIKPAAYSIHIDPNIKNFRQLAKDIAESTAKTKNANQTIRWITDFANDLAGKTNPADRWIQDNIPGGRTTMRATQWLNSKVKANQVLLNARSALSQIANIPVGVSKVKNPVALTKGVIDTMSSIMGKEPNIEAVKQSQFINERYMDNLISRFDTKFTKQPIKMAGWLLEGMDKIGTKFIWNSAYNKAVSEGIAEPVRYADTITRESVAGRGIGEVPLLQKSKVFQLVAPFQLEVTNLWHVMSEHVKAKDFAAMAILLTGNYLFNNFMKSTTGSKVVFDPVGATVDVLTSDDKSASAIIGRLSGELFSNLPVGNVMASQFFDEETRKKYFGSEDPTRFGTGVIVPVVQDATSATMKLIDGKFTDIGPELLNIGSKTVLPFGGAQAKKTYEGLNTYLQGSSKTPDGKMRFPVGKTPENAVKSALFGQYSTNEAREYFDKDRRPLSEKQTSQTENADDKQKAYSIIMYEREYEKIIKSDLPTEEKIKRIQAIREKVAELTK